MSRLKLNNYTFCRPKIEALQILPCTVSQLLSASEIVDGTFVIGNCKIGQVSIVGFVKGSAPFVTNIQYSVDDRTGPPIDVRHWVNTEDSALLSSAYPGKYVRVTGSLRNFQGQRSLLANNIRCIDDPNEITSHMLEVVQAHMQISGKGVDLNMNTTAASMSGRVAQHTGSLSTIQGQVLNIIGKSSHPDGISFHELRAKLGNPHMNDIRGSLEFLLSEGHIYSTIDDDYYKSSHPQ
ncbi:replication protein A 32 kDa subunit-like [Genypterus blacodes]|uniref:replication protein A 32 kDa subunit-like n=1 Tax=Genypterus blacodes TaxID=154954 RepID=UPI003F77146E